MAKKNKETEAPPAAQTLKTAEPPDTPYPAQATAAVEVQEPVPCENTGSEETSPLAHAIEKLGNYLVYLGLERPPLDWQVPDAVIAQIKDLRDLKNRMCSAVLGDSPHPWCIEDFEEAVNGLKARVAELESNAAVERRDVGSTSSADDKGRAAEAYDLFRERQVEGNFPAWAELDERTQKLWRDSYQHVAAGGEPRTDYEEAVKYLIASAQ